MHRRQVIKIGAALAGSQFLLNQSPFVSRALAHTDTASSFGSPASFPIAMPSADGRLELFLVGDDGNVYHTWQLYGGSDPTLGTAWASWFQHGSPPSTSVKDIKLWYNPDAQTLRLYATTTPTGAQSPLSIYSLDQAVPSGYWGGWQQLTPTPPSTITGDNLLLATTTSHLPVVFLGSGASGSSPASLAMLTHNSQAWQVMSMPSGENTYASYSPYECIVLDADGRLEFFVVLSMNNGPREIFHIWQQSPDGPWSNWYSHGLAPSGKGFFNLVVAADAGGRLNLIAQDEAANLYYKAQVSPAGGFGSWSPFPKLPPLPPPYDTQGPATCSQFAIGAHADGRLILFALRSGDPQLVLRITQPAPNGDWSAATWEIVTSQNPQINLATCSTQGRLVYFTISAKLQYTWQVSANGNWAGSFFLDYPT